MKKSKRKVKYLQGDLLNNELNWLIKQAERKQELEEHLEKNRDYLYKCNLLNERLEKQNERYREALEFYADRDNYKLEHFDPNLDDYMSTVDYDEGQKARQTIGSEKIND